jgi:hypothetical protein
VLWGPKDDTWAGGSLSVAGIGYEIVNDIIYVLAHDGSTLTTSGSGVFLQGSSNHNIVIDADGAGNVNWWVNGIKQQSISGGPTISAANYGLCTEAINPTPATETFMAIQRITRWSEI